MSASTWAVIFPALGSTPRFKRCQMRQVARQLLPIGNGVELAWNPEFLREGLRDQRHPRAGPSGLGTARDGNDRAEVMARAIYAQLLDAGIPFVTTDLATAELVKSSANAFLATKISFINAMAEVTEAAGADVVELADALGRSFLNAGLGSEADACLKTFVRWPATSSTRRPTCGARCVAAVGPARSCAPHRHGVSQTRIPTSVGGGHRVSLQRAPYPPAGSRADHSPNAGFMGRSSPVGCGVMPICRQGSKHVARVRKLRSDLPRGFVEEAHGSGRGRWGGDGDV